MRDRKFDGFIVTGAPIGNIPFEEVKYWSEMVEIMDWTQTNVHHTMFICWGAQAALHHFHGAKRPHAGRRPSACFRHTIVAGLAVAARLLGQPDVPVSRYNDIAPRTSSLHGPCGSSSTTTRSASACIDDPTHRALYMLNHLEYDNRSLAEEYERDAKAGLGDAPPINSFPGDDPDLGAGEPLAQPRRAAVPELDQRDLPDDAL